MRTKCDDTTLVSHPLPVAVYSFLYSFRFLLRAAKNSRNFRRISFTLSPRFLFLVYLSRIPSSLKKSWDFREVFLRLLFDVRVCFLVMTLYYLTCLGKERDLFFVYGGKFTLLLVIVLFGRFGLQERHVCTRLVFGCLGDTGLAGLDFDISRVVYRGSH